MDHQAHQDLLDQVEHDQHTRDEIRRILGGIREIDLDRQIDWKCHTEPRRTPRNVFPDEDDQLGLAKGIINAILLMAAAVFVVVVVTGLWKMLP